MKTIIYFLTCLLLLSILSGCLLPPETGISDSSRFILDVIVEGQGIVSGTGINCPTDCTSSYDDNTTLTLTAEPSSGYFFAGWSNACEGTSECIVLMNANKIVNANFQLIPQSDTIRPTISITSPASGSTISGITTISASASDNMGVVSVQFYQNNNLIADDTTAPYSVSWDTRSVPDSTRTLMARARDAAGNTRDTSITVNVKNVQSPEPQLGSWYVPPPGTKWHWQLQGTVNLNYPVDLYSLDVFDTPQSSINILKNRGVKVICYFSAGSAEPWRADYSQFPSEVIGNKMSGWNEYWLDVRNYDKFASIMRARMDLAVEKGCHGIEPDNLNAYEENSGFPLTYNDQIRYNKWLADEAHSRNLSIALKYGIGQVEDLIDHYDFVINEQCFQYNECDEFKAFIDAGKAVLGVEYELSTSQFCNKANAMGYSWMRMNYDLDGTVRETCWTE